MTGWSRDEGDVGEYDGGGRYEKVLVHKENVLLVDGKLAVELIDLFRKFVTLFFANMFFVNSKQNC